MDNYNHEKYDIVSWNTDTNEMKTEKSNVSIAVDYNSNDANYDYMDYYNVDYTENETNYDYIVVLYKDSEECMTLSLLSYTSNGLEEKIIRKNASVELSNLSRVVGKFAYLGDIVGKKVKSKDGYEELKIEKATIYIYDVQSGEEKERAKIDVKDFGEGAQNMYIEEHELEDYCTVSVYFKDKSSKKYKYMFDTKEIKEIL